MPWKLLLGMTLWSVLVAEHRMGQEEEVIGVHLKVEGEAVSLCLPQVW